MAKTVPPRLTEKMLRDTADSGTWQRGSAYFSAGHVLSAEHDGERLRGRVAGSRNYRCWLRVLPRGVIEYDCNCPVGDRGEFCKHNVAAGLAYLREEGDTDPAPPTTDKARKRKRGVTLADVRRYLSEREPDQLVEMIVNRLGEDDAWRDSLFRQAALHDPAGPDFSTFRKSLKQATARSRFPDFHASRDDLESLESAADDLRSLATAGHAEQTIELAEFALKRCEELLEHVDDSNGELQGVMHDLQDIHLQACTAARPEPVGLARRLCEWEIVTPWDTFHDAAQTYADVLGEAGLAEYDRVVRDRWDRLSPAQKKGGSRWGFDSTRSRLAAMMESLARASGNFEALVRVKQQTLSTPWDFVKLAEVYAEAGKLDEAVRWARAGCEAAEEEDRPYRDSRPKLFLAELYQQLDRHEEATALAWDVFIVTPGLSAYEQLHDFAQRITAKGRRKGHAWKAWREKALSRLREQMEAAKAESRKYSNRYSPPADARALVEVFLWENNIDEAWAEAQAHGCSSSLWRHLAQAREADHPRDAVTVYLEMVAPLVEQTNNQAYQEAMELIRRCRDLWPKCGMVESFARYRDTLAEQYKRKRNFVKLLRALDE